MTKLLPGTGRGTIPQKDGMVEGARRCAPVWRPDAALARTADNKHGPKRLPERCPLTMTDTPQNAPEGSNESESHVDQAMLGPTPDNPSLSLKKRLKRAAFFDQREREVAAGEAVPVEADAGLPEQLVEDIEALNRD